MGLVSMASLLIGMLVIASRKWCSKGVYYLRADSVGSREGIEWQKIVSSRMRSYLMDRDVCSWIYIPISDSALYASGTLLVDYTFCMAALTMILLSKSVGDPVCSQNMEARYLNGRVARIRYSYATGKLPSPLSHRKPEVSITLFM